MLAGTQGRAYQWEGEETGIGRIDVGWGVYWACIDPEGGDGRIDPGHICSLGERRMKAASCRHDSRDGGGDAGGGAVRRRRTIARHGPQLATAAAAAASS